MAEDENPNMALAIEHLENAVAYAGDGDESVFAEIEKARYRLEIEWGTATQEQRAEVAEWDAELAAEAAAPDDPCPSFSVRGGRRASCLLEAGHEPPHDYGDQG